MIDFLDNSEHYEIKTDKTWVIFKTKYPLKLSEVKYLKKTTENGITTIQIKIPALIKYMSNEEYSGSTLYFEIGLKPELVYLDSNSMDIDVTDKRTLITWNLTPKILAKGTTLTLKYKNK